MSRHFFGEAGSGLKRLTIVLGSVVVACALSATSAHAADQSTEEQELEREIKRLEKELADINKKIKNLSGKSKAAQSEIGRLTKELKSAQKSGGTDDVSKKKIEDLREQTQDARKSMEKLAAEIESIRKVEQEKRSAQSSAKKKVAKVRKSRAVAEKRRRKEVARKKKTMKAASKRVKRRSDEEIRADARLRTAGVHLPKQLRDMYVWSLPFDERISPKSIWIKKDIVLVLVSGNVLYCVRKTDGVPLWAIELSDRPQFEPSISAQMVYVFVKNRLTAIDRIAGQIVWTIDPEFAPSAAPCVSEPNLYIPSWDKRVYAVEVQSRERVYLVGTDDAESLKSREYYFRYSWHKTTRGHVVSRPTLAEGFLYFGSEDGYVYSVSVDGEDRYRSQTQGPVRAQTSARGGSLYVGSNDFNAYGFNRLTGQIRWIFPTGSDVLQPIYSDAASGIAIIASSKNGVYGISDRLGSGLGTQMWYIPDGGYIAGVSDDRVYLSLTDERLASVDKKTGHVKWMSLLEGISEVVPNLNDWSKEGEMMRLLCIGESGRHLICLREPKEGVKEALKRRQAAR